MRHSSPRTFAAPTAALSAVALTALALTGVTPPASGSSQGGGDTCLEAVHSGSPDTLRERVFAAAGAAYGVPVAVAKGVSYLESRWDDHGTSPSTAGGYGPMHLTDLTPPDMSGARGQGAAIHTDGPAELHTAQAASSLTGIALARITADPTANICAGVALLASYQHQLGKPVGPHTAVAQWFGAVRHYSGSASTIDATTFARRVFAAIGSGQSRVTNDGQRVTLTARPGLRIPPPASQPDAPVDCPVSLGCECVPAP